MVRYRMSRLWKRGTVEGVTLAFTRGNKATFVHARRYRSPLGFVHGWELLYPGNHSVRWVGSLRAVFKLAPSLAAKRFAELGLDKDE